MFGSAISHVGHTCYTLVSSARIRIYLLEKQVDTGMTSVHIIKIRILFCTPHRTQSAYNCTSGCIVKLIVLETVGNFVLVRVLGFVT